MKGEGREEWVVLLLSGKRRHVTGKNRRKERFIIVSEGKTLILHITRWVVP